MQERRSQSVKLKKITEIKLESVQITVPCEEEIKIDKGSVVRCRTIKDTDLKAQLQEKSGPQIGSGRSQIGASGSQIGASGSFVNLTAPIYEVTGDVISEESSQQQTPLFNLKAKLNSFVSFSQQNEDSRSVGSLSNNCHSSTFLSLTEFDDESFLGEHSTGSLCNVSDSDDTRLETVYFGDNDGSTAASNL